jgi:WD repeat-containing protein 35
MKTALRLQEYEDVLNPVDVSSLIALTAFYNRHYQQCSQAFIRLESHPELSTSKQEAYADLALSIFVKSEPEDPPGRAQSCSLCRGPVQVRPRGA